MNSDQVDSFYRIIGWLFIVNIGTFFVVIVTSIRVIQFFSDIQFKVNEMWSDYKARTNPYATQHMHKRVTDDGSASLS